MTDSTDLSRAPLGLAKALADQGFDSLTEVQAAVLDADAPLPEAAAWLPGGVLSLAGPGAALLAEAAPNRTWHRLDVRPSGLAVARLGARLVGERGPDDPASAEPAYLKPVATSQTRAIFGD